MKTILSILEVVLYNLLPATMAAPLILLLKDILPLTALFTKRIGEYMLAGLHKLAHLHYRKTGEEETGLEMERIRF